MISDFAPSTSLRLVNSAARLDTDSLVNCRICDASEAASCSTSRSQFDIVLGSVSPHTRNSNRCVVIGSERFSNVTAS